jgi:hypothetical protein
MLDENKPGAHLDDAPQCFNKQWKQIPLGKGFYFPASGSLVTIKSVGNFYPSRIAVS